MKNIHVLPTDKQSRLVKIYNDVNREKFTLKINGEVNDSFKEYVNIYITNDEEIKEGNWFLHPFNTIHKAGGNLIDKDFKKIILTTDQDLIKDGVQAIDDEFLDWFVKNPSCEFVEFERKTIIEYEPIGHAGGVYKYKTIIPKEEPKQKVICTNDICQGECVECNFMTTVNIEKPKQETLEEVAETQLYITINKIIDGGKNLPKGYSVTRGQAVDYAFKIALEVSKWQQQQNKNLYSEEEIKKAFNDGKNQCWKDLDEQQSFNEWFEQFKKK